MPTLPDLDNPLVTVEDFLAHLRYMQSRLESVTTERSASQLEPVIESLKAILEAK